VIAATNRVEDIDEAMLRRFPIKVYVGVPNAMNREQLILRYLEGLENTLTESDLHHISEMAFGWSASDIEILAREAAMIPVREASICRTGKEIFIRPIEVGDFDRAHNVVILKTHEDPPHDTFGEK